MNQATINISTVSKLQLIWFSLAMAFNLVSYLRVHEGEAALTPTNPAIGIAFVLICGLIILYGMWLPNWLYRIAIFSLGFVLAYSGVFLHVLAFVVNSALDNYLSFVSWFLAVSINVYGSIMFLWGALCIKP